MFAQRQTDSFGLIGTNARNSDVSMESQKKAYGSKQISNYQFEQEAYNFDYLNFTPALGRNRSSTIEMDPAYYLASRNRNSHTESSGMGSFETYNNELKEDMPFNPLYQNILEDSTHDSQCTSQTCSNSSEQRQLYTLSPSNSDLEEVVINEKEEDQFNQNLSYIIDIPLAPKRQRKQKEQQIQIHKSQSLTNESSSSKSGDEEKRRRKDKDQIRFLQQEYAKNYDWDKATMKELAKRIGLKPSQVYKWKWDQKKKEQDEKKAKSYCYPNQIFQIFDSNGNAISRPVQQKFTVNKAQ